MHPIDSAVLKVRRAQTHYRDITAMVATYLDGRPYRVEHRITDNGHHHRFVFHLLRESPAELSILIGDFTHNLRSPLDHLAWQFCGTGRNAFSLYQVSN